MDAGPKSAFIPDEYDDGYESPEFDLPSSNEEDDIEGKTPHSKKRKMGSNIVDASNNKRKAESSLQDEEELALKLLHRTV